MREKDNYKNWDWSRMGKQTNSELIKKPLKTQSITK